MNTDFRINNERQDCKIGSVFVFADGVFVRGEGVMEEMKVREYG
jgi:hypothetical protein